ncbi:MAG TPA: hypothetical protein VG498_19940 [Terriglobales bacterium]|nr:hypothetical protein [Terriglobales bacterium]
MKSLRIVQFGKYGMDDDHYTTSEDVQKIFTENIDSLYLLALLLTGDQEKAEQCFVAGVADSVSATNVFRPWAHAWAKRAIIRNAVRVTHPIPDNGSLSAPNNFHSDNRWRNFADPHFEAVLALQDFERLVFVISVLERYSDFSCALLLGYSVQEIRRGRTQAFEQLTGFLRTARFDEESATQGER